ncbi:hypothetical protein DFQ28_000211 [Apophysomyces sp. BC1034]|nr:hypothetical protein DFQ30_000413 [Apophysomyces sp. BC1015]KAG0168202.1 hypothetical protein DFQ29_010257 [Apophysomyces sp. BC1021]KAG0184059.1 hypothetical protein DFQ28_000211 [Apophysomyces sp. BC1034]
MVKRQAASIQVANAPSDDDPMIEDEEIDDSVYFDDMDSGQGSRSSRSPNQFFREMARTSHHSLVESIDEKGEAVFAMMQQDKIVHQKFFNEFNDDFDDEDMA